VECRFLKELLDFKTARTLVMHLLVSLLLVQYIEHGLLYLICFRISPSLKIPLKLFLSQL
jgi:hypothetical protein